MYDPMMRSLFVLAALGCSSSEPPATHSTAEVRFSIRCDAIGRDHDALYLRGSELIEPHMKLAGADAIKRNDSDLRLGVACLDEVLAIAPSNWAALWIRGKAYQSLEERTKAVDSFRSAYRLQPNNVNVGRELTIELIEVGDFEEAVVVARDVSSREPSDAGLRANYALALVLSGQVTEAKQAIEVALQQDPRDPITQVLHTRISEIASGARPRPRTVRDLKR